MAAKGKDKKGHKCNLPLGVRPNPGLSGIPVNRPGSAAFRRLQDRLAGKPAR